MSTENANGSDSDGRAGSAGTFGTTIFWAVTFAFALTCAAILFWFDPSRYRFYPSCLFHEATGLQCPGCGSLRAIHQLLHGQLAAAFRFNALLVLSLPVIVWLGARYTLRKWGHQPSTVVFKPKWLLLGLGFAIVFTVWRNLPDGFLIALFK